MRGLRIRRRLKTAFSHRHTAVVGSIPAAARGQSCVRALRQSKHRNEHWKAEDREQEDGDQSTHAPPWDYSVTLYTTRVWQQLCHGSVNWLPCL